MTNTMTMGKVESNRLVVFFSNKILFNRFHITDYSHALDLAISRAFTHVVTVENSTPICSFADNSSVTYRLYML